MLSTSPTSISLLETQVGFQQVLSKTQKYHEFSFLKLGQFEIIGMTLKFLSR